VEKEEKGSEPRVVAKAEGTYAGQPVAANFTGSASLGSHDRPWQFELQVENGPTRASAKGTLQEPLSLRGASVDLLVAGPDMALLNPLTGVGFPATPPYELRGNLNYGTGLYRVSDVTGRVGRSDLEGTMTVAMRPGVRPEINADLHSRDVELRDIASLLGGDPGAPDTPGQTPQQTAQAVRIQAEARASPRLLPQGPLNLSNLKRTDLHLAYRAERIQGRSVPLDDLAFRMDVIDGAVGLHPLSFGVGGGRISGEVWLTPQEDGAVRARTEIQFERLDVSHLMRATRYQGAGALSGTARVEGTGRSMADILGKADGAASLWMAGGDLSKLLVDLVGLRLGSALFSSLGQAPGSHVECFVADLELRRGILSTQALLLETEDAITRGDGTVDLSSERVEVRLRTVSKRLTVGVLPAPLLVSGTLKDLRAAPDPKAPAGRGGLAGALAALPMIQLGVGDDPRCKGLLGRARKGQTTGDDSTDGGDAR
jgi:AsmA family protein